MMEDDRLRVLRTPVLVEDFDAVLGGHKTMGHWCKSFWFERGLVLRSQSREGQGKGDGGAGQQNLPTGKGKFVGHQMSRGFRAGRTNIRQLALGHCCAYSAPRVLSNRNQARRS